MAQVNYSCHCSQGYSVSKSTNQFCSNFLSHFATVFHAKTKRPWHYEDRQSAEVVLTQFGWKDGTAQDLRAEFR